jgi:thioesterase domain-containing protein
VDIRQQADEMAGSALEKLKLNGLQSSFEVISNRISRYMEYSYKLMDRRNCTGKVHANIHLIKAEDVFENMSASEKDDQWAAATYGKFNIYQGFGTHEVMLDELYIKNNVTLVKQILNHCTNKADEE